MTLQSPPFDQRYMGVTQPYGPNGHWEHGAGVWEQFGFRDASGAWWSGHNGLDVPTPDRTPLKAVLSGVAHMHWTWTIKGSPIGWAVSIDHDDGTETLYGHISATYVREGQHVDSGTVIALSGGARGESGAGFSTGPHLHIERHVRPVGPTINPYDEIMASFGLAPLPAPVAGPIIDSREDDDMPSKPTRHPSDHFRLDWVFIQPNGTQVDHAWVEDQDGPGKGTHDFPEGGHFSFSQQPFCEWAEDGKILNVWCIGDDAGVWLLQIDRATGAKANDWRKFA